MKRSRNKPEMSGSAAHDVSQSSSMIPAHRCLLSGGHVGKKYLKLRISCKQERLYGRNYIWPPWWAFLSQQRLNGNFHFFLRAVAISAFKTKLVSLSQVFLSYQLFQQSIEKKMSNIIRKDAKCNWEKKLWLPTISLQWQTGTVLTWMQP